MFGKYYDKRVSTHFVRNYSRVPYLDTQIFNVQFEGYRQSRRTNVRTSRVSKSIQRTQEKSNKLSESLRNSRIRVEQDDKKFIDNLRESEKVCIDKERRTWKGFVNNVEQSRINHVKDQKYLDDLLSTNATKAASRLTTVRRWH